MATTLREVGTNRVRCTYHKSVICNNDGEFVDSSTGQSFEFLDNRRDIRKTQVNKLLRVLENGEHFDSPLVVNDKNGKYFLIDGNHRIEAVQQFLAKHPKRKVEVGMFRYIDLDRDEEKATFTHWNSGTKQSANDFIKQYWEDITVTRLFEESSFPWKVTPAWTQSSMEFRLLVMPYLAWKTNPNRRDARISSNVLQFIAYSKSLGADDVEVIDEFLSTYIGLFGNPDRKNAYYRAPIFPVLASLWYKNRQYFPIENMVKRYRKVLGNRIVTEYANSGSAGDTIQLCMNALCQVLNKGYKSSDKLFKISRDSKAEQ